MITQAINLNLIPGQVLPRVNVSQYDSGTRTLRMTLFNGEQIFNVPSGANGYIQGTKPDRTGFQYAATVTAGSNIVTIDITQQMTAVKGEVVCELVLANGDDRIATVNFIIYVEPAALADDTVISDTELPLIEEAAELAERIDGIIAQIDADADKSEAYAVGTKGGTPVPSTDPTYHNNSKYYSEQAAASAASIGDLAEDAEAWAVGTRNGSAVPSTDPAYHNNSKYYAQDAGDKATAAGTSATSASTNALKAEGFAVGEQNGTAVTSGSPYYHNNAEYFAGEASTSATNASTSETNAGLSESAAAQSEEDSEAWAVGERNGVPVTSGDPTYQNNAKYYAQQAGGTALSSLVDVAISSAQNGDVLAYNSTSTKWENKNLNLGSKADKTDIAPVESSSTASQAYAIGDYFYYNGVRYKASAAITSGGTITPGTNCTAAPDVSSEIQTLANLTSSSGDEYSSSSAYKVGDYVIHDNKLYRCITACTAASWATNASCFTQDTLTNAVDTLNSALSKLENDYSSGTGTINSEYCKNTSWIKWACYKKIVTVSAFIEMKAEKPAGQTTSLVTNMPSASGVINMQYGGLALVITGSRITSNVAIPSTTVFYIAYSYLKA